MSAQSNRIIELQKSLKIARTAFNQDVGGSIPPVSAKPKKAKKRVTKAKSKKRTKKRSPKPKPRKPMPAGGLHPRVGRPKAEHVDCTLAAVQPWLDLVPPKSRSTYFRRKRRERLEKAV